MKSLIKKLLLSSLSLVFALSLTFGLGGALKAFAEGETKADLFTDAHVTLTEDIVVKFEYTAPAGYTAATYAFTYRNETTEAKTATVGEGKNTIEFAEANPARTGETIAVALTLSGDGKTTLTDTCEFTVADYLDTLLTAAPSSFETIKTQEQYVAMRTLAANLVNYSAKTQEYIGLEDSSSALLKTETVKNFVGDEQPAETDLAVGALEDTAKYGFIGANLSLDGKVSVNFYFVAESKENLKLEIAFDGGSTVTLTEIEEATEIAVKEGVTAYKAVLSGVSAQDLDKKFTAKLLSNGTAVGNEVTYSVKSYAYAMLSSKNDKMKSLALALYNYGLSAKSYVEAMAKDYEVELPIENSTEDGFNAIRPGTASSANVSGWYQVAPKKSYVSNLTTDGEYFYALAYDGSGTKQEDGKWYNKFNIVKLDENGKRLGYSKEFNGPIISGNDSVLLYGGTEYNTPLWIKDGYAYSYNGDGQTIRIAVASLTSDNVAYEVASDIKFGDNDPTAVSSVVYNATQKKYAVIANKTLYIYDETDLTTATASAAQTSTRLRMGGDENALAIIISNDTVYAPTVYLYDWTATSNGSFKIASTEEICEKDTSKVKPQGVTIYNGNIYYNLISWQSGGNPVAIFKAINVYDEANYSVGEVLENYRVEATAVTLNGWNSTNGAYLFNAIEKNGWIYEYRSCLVRFNPIDKTTVAASALAADKNVIGSDENVAMFAYGDKIFVYDITDKVWKSLPLLFKKGATLTTEESLPINLGSYASSFRNIYVFEDTGNVAVFTGSKIVLLDSTGAEKASYSLPTVAINRMGGSKDGYIYYTTNAQGTANPTVYIINTNNGNMTVVSLPNVSDNPSTSKISSIFELNGTLCYSLFKWGNDSSNIQQISFKAYTGELPYKELGEIVVESEELSSDTTIMASISGTVKGVVTDGEYFYMANCTTTGKVKIIKTNKYGTVIAKTAEFDNGVVVGEENASFNDKTYLLYKDGYIYAYGSRLGTTVYRVKADDIVVGTDVEVEASALPFNGVTKAEAIAYDEANDRYAVRVGRVLYLVDGKTNAVYKRIEGAAVTGTEVGVAADENYVYVLTELTGGIRFYVYDWSGNKVGEVSQTGFIKEESKNANIPSMIIEGGKVYIFAKPWSGTYASKVIIYTIDLNKLAG